MTRSSSHMAESSSIKGGGGKGGRGCEKVGRSALQIAGSEGGNEGKPYLAVPAQSTAHIGKPNSPHPANASALPPSGPPCIQTSKSHSGRSLALHGLRSPTPLDARPRKPIPLLHGPKGGKAGGWVENGSEGGREGGARRGGVRVCLGGGRCE
jgi:hypothetical protein